MMQFQWGYPVGRLPIRQPNKSPFMWPDMGGGYLHDMSNGDGTGRGAWGTTYPFIKGPDMLDMLVTVQQFGGE